MKTKLTQVERIENLLHDIKIQNSLNVEKMPSITSMIAKHGFSASLRPVFIKGDLVEISGRNWKWVGGAVTEALAIKTNQAYKEVNKSKNRYRHLQEEKTKALESKKESELVKIEEVALNVKQIVPSFIDEQGVGVLLEIMINTISEERVCRREFEAKLLKTIERNNALASNLENKFDSAWGASL